MRYIPMPCRSSTSRGWRGCPSPPGRCTRGQCRAAKPACTETTGRRSGPTSAWPEQAALHGAIRSIFAALGQHFRNRLRPRVGQRDRAAADVVVLFMVDADGAEDRGKDLGGADFSVLDFAAVLVAGAIDRAAIYAAAGHGDAPGRGKVVAAQAG